MRILTVSELTRAVKDVLEAEFPFVWVRGQVGNVSRPVSGHLYFNLTDGQAVLPVVWFKTGQDAARPGEVHPLTGEVSDPSQAGLARRLENGMDVLCAGRMNVYPPRGAYQLIAELVQEQGVGDLHLAFEALKRKLSDKGYFDEARKRPVPDNPVRVAVVTSPRGAVIRDFLRIASERGTGCEIRIHPAPVQGDKAPAAIAAALDAVSDDSWAQAVVLMRGGGSLEDLWAFNTEPVADAIFRCAVPVITGIGHEPDVTIADFTADRRAATPSHAAQGLWPLRADLAQQVDGLQLDLTRSLAGLVRAKEQEFLGLRRGLAWLSPAKRLGRVIEDVSHLARRLARAGADLLAMRQADLMEALAGLHRSFGPHAVQEQADALAQTCQTMARAAHDMVQAKATNLDLARAGLTGLNPELPLKRGYSLVRSVRTGRFLRSADDATPGDALVVRVADGRIEATVDAVAKEPL